MTSEPSLHHPDERAVKADATDSELSAGKPTDRAASAAAVPRTLAGKTFSSLVAGAIVVILLLVFILENTGSVPISYFGATGHLPLGIALLLAAVGGALIVGLVGATRIMQLRRHVRRRHRQAG